MSRSTTPHTIATPADREAVLAEIKRLQETNQKLSDQINDKNQRAKVLRSKASKVQQEAECEEEKIGNALLRRVSSLKRENAKIEARRKQSEASKAQVLERIAQVRRQKAMIENRIEAEQELLVNQLHKEMQRISCEKSSLEHRLHNERADFIRTLQKEVDQLRQQQQEQQQQQQSGRPLTPSSSLSGSTALHCDPTAAPAPATGTPLRRRPSGCPTPGAATPSSHSRSASATIPTTEAKILELEDTLCNMLDETVSVKHTTEYLEEENERLLNEIQALQRDSFLERAKAAKMKEDLEKAQSELNFEKQLELKTQRGHNRSASLSSIETMESAQTTGSSVPSASMSSYSATSSQHGPAVVNIAAARDRHQVREHTARVLRSAASSLQGTTPNSSLRRPDPTRPGTSPHGRSESASSAHRHSIPTPSANSETQSVSSQSGQKKEVIEK